MVKKYYAVKIGLKPGIYTNWNDCSLAVKGYPGAKYKGFTTLEEAEDYIGLKKPKAKTIFSKKVINEKKHNIYNVSNIINSETENYYVVAKGKEIGIFTKWEECENNVKGISGAIYKKLKGKTAAINFLSENNIQVIEVKEKTKTKTKTELGAIRSTAKVRKSNSYIDPKKLKDEFGFIAFVDGSYDEETKVYGSGMVLLKDDLINYEIFQEAGIDQWNQWNIVGELQATKLAITQAENLGFKKIVIYHDLKNISLWACGEWQAKNQYTQEYVKFIEESSKKIEIFFVKVKAHSTESIFNDIADIAAKNAIEKYNSAQCK